MSCCKVEKIRCNGCARYSVCQDENGACFFIVAVHYIIVSRDHNIKLDRNGPSIDVTFQDDEVA